MVLFSSVYRVSWLLDICISEGLASSFIYNATLLIINPVTIPIMEIYLSFYLDLFMGHKVIT